MKNWRDGDMRLRWAAAGMLAAQDQFRRVRGFGQLPAIRTAMRKILGDTPTGTMDMVSA